MASIVLMASSTSKVSAMMRAPSEMRCRSILTNCMTGNTIASVNGIESATIAPALTPRLTTLTAMMIAIACHSEVMNSPIALWTTADWSATSIGSMPSGRSAVISAMVRCRLRPRAKMSPPSRMAMATPMPGFPLTRNMGCGGST